jgi:hypothetical protein
MFASGTLSYLLFFPTSFHLYIGRWIHAHIYPSDWIVFPKCEKIGVKIGSYWRVVFSILPKKNVDWEWILKTLVDALIRLK